jgi:hypothetical protein
VNPHLAGLALEPWDLGDDTLVVRITGPNAGDATATDAACAAAATTLTASLGRPWRISVQR